MALESDKDAGRAGLPFEPKRDSKRDKKKAQAEKDSEKSSGASELTSASSLSAKAAKAASRPSKKSKDSSSQVSARAQAKADEILAGNRRQANNDKADDKADTQKGVSSSKAAKTSAASRNAANNGAIPEAVSRRMLRRMAVLSGAPVFLGVGVFFLAYYLKSRQIVELPPIAVLLVTMGCFGLGVLGLTYGVLSASWDSEPGSLVGLSEFKLNFGRVMDARKASKT
jgi:hypothetical protein